MSCSFYALLWHVMTSPVRSPCQGSISSTYLCAASMPVAPPSIRTQPSCQYLIMLLGSTSIKAMCETLVKLTLGKVRLDIV